jgi:hypothetical protein
MSKYDHSKAAAIYKQQDPNNELYKDILGKIQNKVMVPKFIEETGRDISKERLSSEALGEKIIIVAEAIFKALQQENIVRGPGEEYISGRSNDQLFNMILDNLFYGLEEGQFKSILGHVQEVYGAEI